MKGKTLTAIQNIDYSGLSVYTQANENNLSWPLIISIPHAGKIFPHEFLQASPLNIQELRSTEDLFVDEMLFPLAEKGLSIISLNIARAFIDVNRDKIELDEKMFEDYPADKIVFENSRCRSGFGLIHRVNAQSKPIYKDLLSYQEVQQRIKNIYDIYHKRLNFLINRCVQKFGFCYLLDCHSMPSKICSIMQDDSKIDICIGDLFSQSCPIQKSDVLIEALRQKGYQVVKNIPYSGAYTTFNYCQPRKNIYTLQLEVNRALYADEKTLSLNTNFEKLQKNLSSSILEFAEQLKI